MRPAKYRARYRSDIEALRREREDEALGRWFVLLAAFASIIIGPPTATISLLLLFLGLEIYIGRKSAQNALLGWIRTIPSVFRATNIILAALLFVVLMLAKYLISFDTPLLLIPGLLGFFLMFGLASELAECSKFPTHCYLCGTRSDLHFIDSQWLCTKCLDVVTEPNVKAGRTGVKNDKLLH